MSGHAYAPGAPEPTGHTAIEALGLTKSYRRGDALKDCSFRLPAGRICGLVGPNGAGKSTLLSLATGVLAPSGGAIRVHGHDPRTLEARQQVAYLAQDKPLYPRLTVAETLRLGRELNPASWDQERAEGIVRGGTVPFDAKVGSLSGGQRTRLALALCFGKRPALLLLDEPMADLDPLVRHDITGVLMAEAAEHGTTIVMSSHALTELDGVCDYLLLLTQGRVRLAGEVEELTSAHSVLIGATTGNGLPPELSAHTVIETRTTGRQITAVVRREDRISDAWAVSEPSLEELLLAYLRSPDAPALLTPSAQVTDHPTTHAKGYAA
ncbi:ABC transporter ATP-binding protein [Streptomyces tsukubensis]|uniref:ABC transporter ATP-binding protein n=1 Tax=Streptomyces tsukubensis TaxID=83656 RepID=A0A1V4A143_9ACTN|nr:ABC transporter ATP-binding protein [Streptomyces tsukubensis]OON72224.1 ABC transporter ATP-binding protein [Streptomyces tsukubensis]